MAQAGQLENRAPHDQGGNPWNRRWGFLSRRLIPLRFVLWKGTACLRVFQSFATLESGFVWVAKSDEQGFARKNLGNVRQLCSMIFAFASKGPHIWN
jgi:hypothetical protein